MNKEEQLRRLIIEAIHGLPYEEALRKEFIEGCVFSVPNLCISCGKILKVINNVPFRTDIKYFHGDYKLEYLEISKHSKNLIILGLPITIGRVMQAFENKNIKFLLRKKKEIKYIKIFNQWTMEYAFWKLTKENGQECTLEDQGDETISQLYKLFKQNKDE